MMRRLRSKQAQPYQCLRDTDTTPDNMKVGEYIRRIERKYYDSCSVGYRGGKETCRLDGKEHLGLASLRTVRTYPRHEVL